MRRSALFALVASSLLASFASPLRAQPGSAVPPLPPPGASGPASASSSASSASAPAQKPAPSESDRGARGESCRARADCQSGLACVQNVCRYPDEGAICGARADCLAPLACIDKTCTVPGERPIRAQSAEPRAEGSTAPAADEAAPAVIEHPFQLDLDEVLFARQWTTGAAVVPNQSIIFSSTILGVRYRAPHLEIEGELPFAAASLSSEGSTNGFVASGNPAVGVYYAHDFPRARLRVGGILTLPVAPDGLSGDAALPAGLAPRGFDGVWLWLPGTFTLAPSVRFASPEGQGMQHATEIVLAPLIPTNGGKTQLIMQASADLAGQVSLFRAGARAEAVLDQTGSGNHTFYSLMPYLGVHASGGFADVGLVVNLNDPAGFSFDEGKYWGLRLRGGVRF